MLSPGRVVLLSLLMSAAAYSAPIDEFRISDIERQLNDLQTTVREQARVITQLQQQSGIRTTTTNNKPAAADTNTTLSTEARWLTFSRWQQLKPGMSELQVVELLGAPTQFRSSDNGQERHLLYALEIGRSGFLSGKVTMVQGKVAAVETPALR